MPVFDEWLAAGIVPRDFYRTVGEEMARAGVTFGGSPVHIPLCPSYITEHATDEQKRRWLPGMASGRSSSRSR
ncbi:acyl-CoA dehydrogenase family protein [Rhodococcus sp. NM-2]|uniref:acyl-CoA dehydrogenase family protein n=1 Tax=Rhodococcus sp. NM-2 TaxID=3401174 RepID=UPI003517D0A5